MNFNDKKIKNDLISFSHLSNKLGNTNEKFFIEEGINLENEIEVK